MPNEVGRSQIIRFAKLTGQPFQVLAILLEQPSTVVTREELQKRLWPDTFVDVDHTLNTAINRIREALGDSSEKQMFRACHTVGKFCLDKSGSLCAETNPLRLGSLNYGRS